MKATRAMCATVMFPALLAGCAAMCSTDGAARGSTQDPSATERGKSPPISDAPGTAIPDDPGVTWWSPDPGISWQLQLTGTIDTSVDADVFTIDGLDTPVSTVAAIHDRGARAICYISAGTFEDWRTDAGRFPEGVLGNALPEWPGERWLDVRRLDALEPVIARRMDICAEKGFDAVDPDNLDGYANDSGFPLSYEDRSATTGWSRSSHTIGVSESVSRTTSTRLPISSVTSTSR